MMGAISGMPFRYPADILPISCTLFGPITCRIAGTAWRDIAIRPTIHIIAARTVTTTGRRRSMLRARRFQRLGVALAGVILCGLTGCGTVNEKLGAGMADYVPHWAGGLPADAPPRPGTPQYEAYMKEQERLRSMPAAERAKLEATRSGQNGEQPAPTSSSR